MENIIFKAKVGSHAYGTNIECSDEDFKGVYIQSPQDILINGYQEQVNISKDETYYEIKRFIELCCKSNPTMIELLYSPEDCIIYKHPIFDLILTERDNFLSKSCRLSFGNYAINQITKAKGLNKKMNWENERKVRKTPLDFCYIVTRLGAVELKEWLNRQKNPCHRQELYGVAAIDHCRDLYHIYPSKGDLGYHGIVKASNHSKFEELIEQEILSNELRLSSIPKEEMLHDIVMYYNKDGYTKHCKDYREYTEWLKKRNTQRYVDIEEHGQKIDGKNLLHCFRLLEMGIEITQGKGVIVRRPNAAFLIDIRKGKMNLDELLSKAEDKLKELENAFKTCNLPDHVDRSKFMKLLTKIREEYYKNG